MFFDVVAHTLVLFSLLSQKLINTSGQTPYLFSVGHDGWMSKQQHEGIFAHLPSVYGIKQRNHGPFGIPMRTEW